MNFNKYIRQCCNNFIFVCRNDLIILVYLLNILTIPLQGPVSSFMGASPRTATKTFAGTAAFKCLRCSHLWYHILISSNHSSTHLYYLYNLVPIAPILRVSRWSGVLSVEWIYRRFRCHAIEGKICQLEFAMMFCRFMNSYFGTPG